jgi:putative heme-binding domain-containing protein
MAKNGAGRMPHLGSTVIDERGLALIAQWIQSLPNPPTAASQATATNEVAQDRALKTLAGESTTDEALASIDALLATTEGSLKLVTAMEEGRVPASYRTPIVDRAKTSAQETVRDLFSRFVTEPTGGIAKLGMNPDVPAILALPGDAERGRKVFYEASGGVCARCHIIGDKGIDFGPNLSRIGAKYSRAEMLDNILYPSKTIAPGYQTFLVRTKAKTMYAGFLVSKSDTQIVLKDQERNLITLNTADIDTLLPQTISAMPEGVISDLTPQQAADLLEFLVTRK